MSVSQSTYNRYQRMAKADMEDGLKRKPTCRFCGALREYVTQDIGIGLPVGYPLECDCVTRVYAEYQDQLRMERGDAGYERRVRESGIPALFIDAKTGMALESLYLFGKSGTGKTHTACALLMKAIRQGMTALYVTMGELGGSGFDERESLFAKMRRVDALCIDDLGKAETSEWANALAFRAIDERYGTGKTIIVTSNYSPNELAAALARKSDEATARAIASRICGMTRRVEMEGEDRRLA